jgi:hypothetical protein
MRVVKYTISWAEHEKHVKVSRWMQSTEDFTIKPGESVCLVLLGIKQLWNNTRQCWFQAPYNTHFYLIVTNITKDKTIVVVKNSILYRLLQLRLEIQAPFEWNCLKFLK